MGWWEGKKGLLIGDGPLDIAEEFLERVSNEYQRDHGRRPSIQEVLGCLVAVLRNDGMQWLNESPGATVKDLVAKLSSKAPISLRPGDIFSVPLRSGGYGFGRLTPQVSVADLFEAKSSGPLSASRLTALPHFRLPALLSLASLKSGRWRVIDHVPYREGEFRVQPLRVGKQLACGDVITSGFLDTSSRLRTAGQAELEGAIEISLWNAELVEVRLDERLRGIPLIAP